jgi:hypothetical protein
MVIVPSFRQSETIAFGFYNNSKIHLEENFERKITDYHGNYQTVKDMKRVVNYCTKTIFINNPQYYQNDLSVTGILSYYLGEFCNYLSLSQRMIAAAEEGDLDLAIDMLKKEDPEQFTTRASTIRNNLQDMYLRKVGYKTTFPFESYTPTPELAYFLKLLEKSVEALDNKTLIVIGSPETGKTKFLEAYVEQKLKRRACVINHREGLVVFRKGYHQAIIFDDPDFSQESRENLLAMLGNDSKPIKIRYINVQIPSDVVKVVASNKQMKDINSYFEDEAIERRIMTCDIGNKKLFDIEKTITMAEDVNEKELLKLKKQFNEEFNEMKMRTGSIGLPAKIVEAKVRSKKSNEIRKDSL